MRYVRRLLGVLALGVLISVLPLAGYLYLLHQSGECISSRCLADMSCGEPMLWSSVYYHCGILRPGIAARLHPQVAVFGSSRMLQFRDHMFAKVPEHRFYVAGTSGNFTLPCLVSLKRLSRSPEKPELVIWGLDYWWFQSTVPPEQHHCSSARALRWLGYHRYRQLREARHLVGREWTDFVLDQAQLLQTAWRDPRWYAALRQTSDTEPESGRKLIGVHARLTGDGYRNDGSYRYSRYYQAWSRGASYPDPNNPDWLDLPYQGNYVLPEALEDVREFIEECRQQSIALIVFLPPIYKPALDHIRTDPRTSGFWASFPNAIRKVCVAQNVPYFDFTDVHDLNTRKGTFGDWSHPSEKLNAQLILKMCADPQTKDLLLRYVDTRQLEQAVRCAGDGYLLFGD
jgi:hypothetical protein